MGGDSIKGYWRFLATGFMALGGGISMLPHLEEIAREEAGVNSEEFLHIMAVAQSFPGAMGINAASIIGYRMGGWKGLAAGVLGVTIPSVICAGALFFLLRSVADAAWFEIGAKALKAAIIGIIMGMVADMAARSWKGFKPVLLGLAALLLFYRFQINPILILLGAGILGYIFLTPPREEV